jgi:uncharacterized protein YbbC (DUF1343 family)
MADHPQSRAPFAHRVRTGLECCLENPPSGLQDASFGLLMNQASVDHQFRYSCDVLAKRFPGKLRALFSPQHGLWCHEQANMIESPHGRHEPLGIPIYSLYSETRRPTREMLAGLDCFVIDLQDVGTRVYTFAWTMLECMKACAAAKIPVVILDRPNPIGGIAVEGPLLVEAFTSFVGGASIPVRHGLTLAELAILFNTQLQVGADLHVIPMEGWRREMLFSDAGLPWIAPSPNMPRLETALLYPGQVLLEGTNLSEGRGTTMPFELIGAPFIDPYALASEIAHHEHPGLTVRPLRFQPTFDKWQAQSCGGIAIHITEPAKVQPVRFTVDVLATVRRLYPHDFAWLPPPYEYEREKPPIDILYGSDKLRKALEDQASRPVAPSKLAAADKDAWFGRIEGILLYN